MRVMTAALSIVAAAAALVPAPLSAAEEVKLGGRRIVGGEKADIKDHPWQVALGSKGLLGVKQWCGGSIIAQDWVLTAAHCFDYSTKPGDFRAKSGQSEFKAGAWIEIDQVFLHEGYDRKTKANDIALVRLKAPHSGRIIPMASKSTSLRVGQSLEVTGWGQTSEGGSVSGHLMKASVPYVDNSTCNEPASYHGEVRESMMCAGRREGGIDACQGDSGGPLVLRGSSGPVLVGVVSWGEGCAQKLKYGIYTRVASYRDWIQSTISANRK
ncbi:MAG: serine protease [Pseudomonadota bacterium]